MTFTQKTISDENIFPTKYGKPKRRTNETPNHPLTCSSKRIPIVLRVNSEKDRPAALPRCGAPVRGPLQGGAHAWPARTPQPDVRALDRSAPSLLAYRTKGDGGAQGPRGCASPDRGFGCPAGGRTGRPARRRKQ